MMWNELVWVVLIIATFGFQIIGFKIWGKKALYVWCGISVILANIQVIMTVELFWLVATLGNVIYGASFLATDILTEIYGEKSGRRGVWIGFFSLIVMTVIMWICLQFIPHSTDWAYPHLKAVFAVMPRIAIASLLGYIVSQLHDVKAYMFWRSVFSSDNQVWIRNNLSTSASQFLDSIIFVSVAFWGVYSVGVFIQILMTTYFIKLVVACSDTPFIYLAKWIKRKYDIDGDIDD